MNSVPSSLWEWLAPLEPDERFALSITSILFGIVAIVFIVGLVSYTVGNIHRIRLEATLKRELLDRGLSAAEIAAVIAASGAGARIDGNLPKRG